MKNLLAALLCLISGSAFAADNYWQTPGGASAQGQVDMYVNSNGQAVPCTATACGGTPSAIPSTTNSSVTPLGTSAVFTGTSVDMSNYGSMAVTVATDQTGTLAVQQSSDGTNWDFNDTYTVTSTGIKVIIPRQARYMRVVYTNGGVAQATFRLQALQNQYMPTASAVVPGDATTLQNDFLEAFSVNGIYNGSTINLQRDVVGSTPAGTGVAGVGVIPNSSSNGGITPAVSNGAVSTLVGKVSSGNRYKVRAVNLTSTAGFLVGYNATGAPADGALTGSLVLECYPLPANGFAGNSEVVPLRYSVGITYILTSATTCYMKTTGVITGAIQTEVE